MKSCIGHDKAVKLKYAEGPGLYPQVQGAGAVVQILGDTIAARRKL